MCQVLTLALVPDLDVEVEIASLDKTKQYELSKGEESSWVTLIKNPVERRKAGLPAD
jgi:hypothetical protein